jgi:Asp-tRNA(Asn)/Glu-tRNA(Gln) amidotransferase B subunit
MRCDVNISLSNSEIQGSRVEVKNVLGTRFVEKVIELEIVRHANLLSEGIDL